MPARQKYKGHPFNAVSKEVT